MGASFGRACGPQRFPTRSKSNPHSLTHLPNPLPHADSVGSHRIPDRDNERDQREKQKRSSPNSEFSRTWVGRRFLGLTANFFPIKRTHQSHPLPLPSPNPIPIFLSPHPITPPPLPCHVCDRHLKKISSFKQSLFFVIIRSKMLSHDP